MNVGIESVTLDRDVLVARQGQVTHPAAEVLHVPEPPLGRRVLRGEDELVTGLAPRDVHLGGEVSSTEEVTLNYKIVIRNVLFLNLREAIKKKIYMKLMEIIVM